MVAPSYMSYSHFALNGSTFGRSPTLCSVPLFCSSPKTALWSFSWVEHNLRHPQPNYFLTSSTVNLHSKYCTKTYFVSALSTLLYRKNRSYTFAIEITNIDCKSLTIDMKPVRILSFALYLSSLSTDRTLFDNPILLKNFFRHPRRIQDT